MSKRPDRRTICPLVADGQNGSFLPSILFLPEYFIFALGKEAYFTTRQMASSKHILKQ